MEKQSKNFIGLINSYVNKTNVVPNEPNWGRIYELAKIHSLTGMLYVSIKDKELCDDKEALNALSNSFVATVKHSIIQERVAKNLVDILAKNNIKHILFKGLILRSYYSDPELRTMGDIDIVIDEKLQNKVHEILLNEHYLYDETGSHRDVRNYSKNGVCFEIHTKVISKDLFKSVDYIDYFSDIFNHSKQVGEYTYLLKDEFHLIYLITHMAKHFKFGGCGVRMVLDIALYCRHFADELDWVWIREQLIFLKLSEFAGNIFALCNQWFDVNINVIEKNIGGDKLDVIADYIVAGGVFGYHNKNLDAIRIDNLGRGLLKKTNAVIGLVFPSYEHLKTRYVWFEKMPRWMLPVGWARFWWYRLVKNRENSFKRIKLAFGSNGDAYEHRELMNLVGLDKG